MRRLAAILLIGALAVVVLTGCGENERRTAAIESKSASPNLLLTVMSEANAPGFVAQNAIYNGRRAGGTTGTSCASAADPGKTCTWQYQRQCNADDPDCIVSLRLIASAPPAGVNVTWEGCTSTNGARECVVELPGSVKARFVSKASPLKLNVSVLAETNASGFVAQDAIYNAGRTGGTPGTSCALAPAPGTTCTWEYQPQCAAGADCIVSLRLIASAPPAGVYVIWEGCTSTNGARECVVELPGSVKARFVSKASLPKLSLTVVRQANASGSVKQGTIANGRRADGTSGETTCVSAAEPGTTCAWEYEKVCPSSDPGCVLSVYLIESPAAGTLVNWTGCPRTGSTSTGAKFCEVPLAGTVRATLVPDPKG